MLIVAYDIQADKLRTRFSKYLSKFGFRLQYSVFQIRNSKRILENLMADINGRFAKEFTQGDSVIIFDLSKQCKIHRFGYAVNEESDLIVVK